VSDGFGFAPDLLGSLATGMNGVADSLGGAGQAIGTDLGGDFGHPALNSVIGQTIGTMQTALGQLGQHAGYLSEAVTGAQQAYHESDASTADSIVAATFNPPPSQGAPVTPDLPGFTGDGGDNPLLL
jgi:hypothetical protein